MLSLCGGLAAPSVQAQPADQSAERRALVLFEAAELRYQEGRFDEAIGLLEEAWAIHPAPPILYNLGRAHEELGHTDQAIDAYRRYLQAEPSSPARGEVEARIEALEPPQAPAPEPEPVPLPEPVLSPEPPPAPSPTPPLADTSTSPLPFVVAATGAVVLGAGLVFAVLSRSELEAAQTERVHLEARDAYRRAETFALFANVGMTAGAVVLAVGAALIVLDALGAFE